MAKKLKAPQAPAAAPVETVPPANPFAQLPAELLALAEADLARSGLTLEDAAALGCLIVDADALAELGHSQPEAGIVFPYWSPALGRFQPLAEFHRARLLTDTRTGFAAQTKARRYSQPAGTLNSVYVPRIVEGEVFDWKRFFEDPRETLYITEGEKKAAAGCKRGLHCIGLGGVDVFQARKRGAEALPLMEDIDFRARDVGVIFDTDTPEGLKPEVLRSAKRLLDWLLLKGARPFLVTLPYADGTKMGLDDYLLDHTAADFMELRMTNSLVHADATCIAAAAADYRYIIEIDRFVGDDPQLMMPPAHLDRVLGLKQVTIPRLERVKDANGTLTTRMLPRPTQLSDALLIWPGTEKFRSMVYHPGKSRHVTIHGEEHLNIWRGWKCEYAGANTLPSEARRSVIMREWLWSIENLFGCDEVAHEYAINWLLYPLQNAGAKMNTFALICSREEGIGKSFIGHMLAKHVYGLTRPGARHAWQLSEGDLHGQFNPFMFATSFVEGDDIAAHDKKSVYERIKSFVTSDTIQINIKNSPQFMMDNHCNFWLTSNDGAPFYLNEDSRRAFVHVPRKPRKDPERYHALQLLFDSGEAGPTLLHYAREIYQANGFNPMHDAPMTTGKKELAMNARTGAKEWIYDLVAGSEALLTRPYASAREIHALMEMEQVQGKYSLDMLGALLREAGATRWGNGAQFAITSTDGSVRRERVWMLGDMRLANSMDKETISAGLVDIPFGYSKGKVVQMRRAGTKY